MQNHDDDEERIDAVLGKNTEKSTKNFLKWRKHFLSNVVLPLRVSAIQDFPWEEPYVFGGWDKKKYEKLKKKHPSYTDQFELNDIMQDPIDEDLIAIVKRISDRKIFHLELSWLEACEDSGKAYIILSDYSTWHCNY